MSEIRIAGGQSRRAEYSTISAPQNSFMMARAIPEKKKEVIVLNYEVPTTSHKPHTLWTRYNTKKVPGKFVFLATSHRK